MSDADVLDFCLDKERPVACIVNLNNATSQNEMEQVFTILLHLLLSDDIQLLLGI